VPGGSRGHQRHVWFANPDQPDHDLCCGRAVLRWFEQEVLANAIVEAADNAQMPATRPLIQQYHQVADRTSELLNDLVAKQTSDTLAIERSATDAYDRSEARTLLGTALALVLGVASALFIGTRTTRAVGDVARAARQVAGGNLAVRALVTTDDELQILADDFNAMAASLQRHEYERSCSEAALRDSEARHRYLMEQPVRHMSWRPTRVRRSCWGTTLIVCRAVGCQTFSSPRTWPTCPCACLPWGKPKLASGKCCDGMDGRLR
jgi:HAMP domain-containing protein